MRSLTIRLLFALASLHVCNVYAAFTIGDRVQANGLVWVRQTPGGAYVGDQASGVQGTILDGPIVAKIGGVGNNYNWYKIDWPSPPDGWVADVGLVVVPPNKPTAQTKTATSIADTSATLNGYINPNGQGTTAYFEYGTTTGYGSTTPQGNFGTTPQDLAYPISGLTPGTIYHFRIVAYNSGGTRYGNDQTFQTPKSTMGAVSTLMPLCIHASDSTYNVIDLLVAHTPSATSAAGATSALQHAIITAIANMNSALANSHISSRIRLLATKAVTYHESGVAPTDLERLLNPHDTFLDEVSSMRGELGADLVALIVGNSDQGGIAKELTGDTVDPNNASVLATYRRMMDVEALAHELGHVMGAGHAWVTVDDDPNHAGGGIFPFSYGYQFTHNGQVYGDIMSYAELYTGPNGLPGKILPYYSNPQVTWQGVPIGRAADVVAPADNARTLNATGSAVAQFQPTRVSASSSIRVANSGDVSLTITSIAITPTSAWITLPVSLPILIPPGEASQIPVNVDFAKAPPGFSNTRLVVTSDASGNSASDSEVLIMLDKQPASEPPQVAARSVAGSVVLSIVARPQEVVTVWKSSDLRTWSSVFQTNSPGAFTWTGTASGLSPYGFFKVSAP